MEKCSSWEPCCPISSPQNDYSEITSHTQTPDRSRPSLASSPEEARPSDVLQHNYRNNRMAWVQSCTCWNEITWVAVGSHSSVVKAPAAKAGGPRFDSQWLPGFFALPAGLLMLMGWRICGALVQFDCYQHRYEWKDLWCSSNYSSAAISHAAATKLVFMFPRIDWATAL